jgi:hypothetical protein
VEPEAGDESLDCFVVGDLWNLDAHLRETPNVLAQWFILSISDPLQIVLVAELFTSSNEIVDEGLPEFLPRIKIIRWQANQPLVTYMTNRDWEVVRHDVLISHS